MATDRARNSYDPQRQYRSVVAQQGRVTLEADANEAERIRADASRAELIEIIGPTGSPDQGFRITRPPGSDRYGITISAGTIYVGGVRVYQRRNATFEDQRKTEWLDLGEADAPTTKWRNEIVYLELVEQEVTAVEDPALREVALGGPDTTGRTRLVQRVRRGTVKGTDCIAALVELLEKRNPGLVFATQSNELLSKAQLKVKPVVVPLAGAECQPIAKSGFLGAENQLIRVQASSTDDLVWGYDNASALYRAKSTVATVLELVEHPVDEFHRPRPHQWVEVLRAAVHLGGEAYVANAVGELHEVDRYDTTTNTITLKTQIANTTAPLFVRVWEGRVPFGSVQDLAATGLRIETEGTATPGDYWMIGVRPTQSEQVYPQRLLDAFQRPDGPHRWATPLATIAWKDEGLTGVVHDCRRPFKPLTEDDDFAFHNQHLHGWGVVCGLQVHCMELEYASRNRLDPAEWITVRNGYAIDPTGLDIRLSAQDKLTPVPIVDLAVTEGGLERVNGKIEDGSVSLWIDRHKQLRVDPYERKQAGYDWKALWAQLQTAPPGESLLANIYRGCILRVIDYIRALVPESSDPNVTFAQRTSAVVRGVEVPSPAQGLVGESARRLIALLNLVWQVNNPKTSRHIYLSGDPQQPMSLWTEDGLLRSFFEDLKQLLQSKTFCAMFDDVEYPAYDVYARASTVRPSTIFGTNRHTRIRVHHTQKLAFTCGNGQQINVYDLTTGKILRCVDFPVADADVQDVAFSNTTNEIYAIAWVGTQKAESMFAGGVFTANGDITWSGRKHRAQLKLVTLVNDPNTTEVYISARGSGVYRFDPCSTTDATLPTGGLVQVGPGFSASGHLVGGTVNISDRAANERLCVNANLEPPDSSLMRPWVHAGYRADSLDPLFPLRVDSYHGRHGIAFRSAGARFVLPVPASSVTAEVHVRSTPITMAAFDPHGALLGKVTSTPDMTTPQLLELDVAAGNIAYLDLLEGSSEGLLYELCIDSNAPGGWRLFAGEDQTKPSSVEFDRVREIDVKNPAAAVFHPIPPIGDKHGMGHDDIAFAGEDLQAIVDGPNGTRRLLTWQRARGNPDVTDLGESGGCRIAYSKQDGGWSLVTYLDKYLGRAWRKTTGLESGEFHPLQILPVSVAADRNGETFYVLEFFSNTITAIPATSARTQIDANKLEAYRVAALTAFLALFRRFAQYLKDCICEHLLVECPDPKGKKVYLADIAFKNGAVYQICNFHHRRYVHTFPTVEYWMSLVPVLPFLKMQVERFCCDLRLGDFFDQHVPPSDVTKAKADSSIPPVAYLYGMTHLKTMSLKSFTTDRYAQLFKVAEYGMQKFSRPAPGTPATATPTAGYTNITVTEAVARAREDGMRVANVVEAKSVVDASLKIARGTPAIRRGEAIDLITDDGKVIGVARSAAPPSVSTMLGSHAATHAIVPPQDEIAKLREELRAMRSEIDELKRR